MSIQSYKEIIAWQKAHELVLKVYIITKRFPDEEKFGLSQQMRRAAVSVASNIVEGFARNGVKDSLRFYNQAEASLKELSYQLLLSYDLGFVQYNDFEKINTLSIETNKVLIGWIKGHIKKPTQILTTNY